MERCYFLFNFFIVSGYFRRKLNFNVISVKFILFKKGIILIIIIFYKVKFLIYDFILLGLEIFFKYVIGREKFEFLGFFIIVVFLF